MSDFDSTPPHKVTVALKSLPAGSVERSPTNPESPRAKSKQKPTHYVTWRSLLFLLGGCLVGVAAIGVFFLSRAGDAPAVVAADLERHKQESLQWHMHSEERQYQTQIEIRGLYNTVLTGTRSAVLERAPTPPHLDGGAP